MSGGTARSSNSSAGHHQLLIRGLGRFDLGDTASAATARPTSGSKGSASSTTTSVGVILPTPTAHRNPLGPSLSTSSITLTSLLTGQKRPREGSGGATRGGGDAAASAAAAPVVPPRSFLYDPMLTAILSHEQRLPYIDVGTHSVACPSAYCLAASSLADTFGGGGGNGGGVLGSTRVATSDSPSAQQLLREAVAAARARSSGGKLSITQTVKFAGQTMQVTKLVDAGTQAAKAATAEAEAARARAAIAGGEGALSSATASGGADFGSGADANIPGASSGGMSAAASAATAGATAPPPLPSGTAAGRGGVGRGGSGGNVSLDAIVSNLDRPEAISTLTKSSLDWETYKHAQGLGDELERLVERKVVGFYVEGSALD